MILLPAFGMGKELSAAQESLEKKQLVEPIYCNTSKRFKI